MALALTLSGILMVVLCTIVTVLARITSVWRTTALALCLFAIYLVGVVMGRITS